MMATYDCNDNGNGNDNGDGGDDDMIMIGERGAMAMRGIAETP